MVQTIVEYWILNKLAMEWVPYIQNSKVFKESDSSIWQRIQSTSRVNTKTSSRQISNTFE